MLLLVLSASTMIFADVRSGGSYKLIIEKIINANEFAGDAEALKAAQEQEYTFQVRGSVLSGSEYKPFNETVKVNGGEQFELSMDNMFSASVVEMTDNSNVAVPGWQMSTSDFQSTMYVREREANFSINKPNGQITISKPSNLPYVLVKVSL